MTLEQWQARLASYLAAEAAVLSSQEYEIDTGIGRRKLRRADLGEIRRGISECRVAVAKLTPGGMRRTFYVEPE
jgi:hypothetical protein